MKVGARSVDPDSPGARSSRCSARRSRHDFIIFVLGSGGTVVEMVGLGSAILGVCRGLEGWFGGVTRTL